MSAGAPDVIAVLTGVPDDVAALEALAAQWVEGTGRAYVVTPPPSPALAGLLARLEGDVDVLPVPAGTRFAAAVEAALARSGATALVVITGDVRVGPGWWEPLRAALEGGASLAIATVSPEGPGTGSPCYQDIGVRTCKEAPDHAAGLLFAMRRDAAGEVLRPGEPFAPACGARAHLRARFAGRPGALAEVSCPARWVRRPFWDAAPATALPSQVRVRAHPEGVAIGAHTYFDGPVQVKHWMPGERLVIGAYCSVADGVTFLTGGGHRTNTVTQFPLDWVLGSDRMISRTYQTTRDTVVGNDVWIGTHAMIMGGVRVGDGAIVAAGAVVFSDVPPYAIVAGNPARVVKYRFASETVQRLLRIAWWSWPEALVRERLEWFYRPIREFCDAFDPAPPVPASAVAVQETS
jgi:acetyltransferase-like isoleucine patch superfamily enzyme